MMKRIVFSVMVAVLTVGASSVVAFAQAGSATGAQVQADFELLRHDLRSEKKKILAANLPLTTDEATRFWPVYDQYTLAMSKHYDAFYEVIKEYAKNQMTLTDDQANSLIKKWSDEQVAVAQTRQKWVPAVQKVLPGKKAALFFQIDRRLYAAMDLQVASEIPLVIQ
jgi:uncharacterized protein YceK